MKEQLLIDVSGIMDEETFHEYLSYKLDFPACYGYNLDALWECITDDDMSSMPRTLVVEGLASLKGFLPKLHNGFVECLMDYKNEIEGRDVIFRQDSPSGEGVKFE